jgi:hypothetical protein
MAFAPAFRKRRAVAAPKPAVAPVIKTVNDSGEIRGFMWRIPLGRNAMAQRGAKELFIAKAQRRKGTRVFPRDPYPWKGQIP